MSEIVDLNFLARLIERNNAEQREMRAELADMRGELGGVRGDLVDVRNDLADMRRAILQLIEKAQRHERRFDELEHRIVETKDDMELMIRSELMGRLAHFETRLESRFGGLAEGDQPLLTP
jgi:chromosome segregation ATPase